MIRNLILDMGNVLLRYEPERALRELCGEEEGREKILRELFEGPEWIQADLGRITEEEMYESVKRRVPAEFHPALRRCIGEWDLFTMEPVAGAREFFDACRKKGYGMYLLSNASERIYRYFPRFLPFSAFDGAVVSCSVHLIKPDPAIYRHLCAAYGLDAASCLMVDDREDNILGARRAGMQGVVFRQNFPEILAEFRL